MKTSLSTNLSEGMGIVFGFVCFFKGRRTEICWTLFLPTIHPVSFCCCCCLDFCLGFSFCFFLFCFGPTVESKLCMTMRVFPRMSCLSWKKKKITRPVAKMHMHAGEAVQYIQGFLHHLDRLPWFEWNLGSFCSFLKACVSTIGDWIVYAT